VCNISSWNLGINPSHKNNNDWHIFSHYANLSCTDKFNKKYTRINQTTWVVCFPALGLCVVECDKHTSCPVLLSGYCIELLHNKLSYLISCIRQTPAVFLSTFLGLIINSFILLIQWYLIFNNTNFKDTSKSVLKYQK
jgi:hypothetical protein